jgi:hypothetical protein
LSPVFKLLSYSDPEVYRKYWIVNLEIPPKKNRVDVQFRKCCNVHAEPGSHCPRISIPSGVADRPGQAGGNTVGKETSTHSSYSLDFSPSRFGMTGYFPPDLTPGHSCTRSIATPVAGYRRAFHDAPCGPSIAPEIAVFYPVRLGENERDGSGCSKLW